MGYILRVAIALCLIGVLAAAQSQQPRGSLLDLALDRKNLAEKCPDLEECDIILLTLDSIQADRVAKVGDKETQCRNQKVRDCQQSGSQSILD